MKIPLIALISFLTFSANAANRDSAVFYFEKGLQEKKERIYLTASRSFEKALSFDPSFADAYLQNAYVLLEMKKLDPAMQAFTKVHSLQPNNKEVIKELMNLHYNFRQFTKATEFANKCADCTGASRIVGMSYFKDEDYGRAEKALIKAMTQEPDNAELTYTLGRTYLEMDQFQKAIPLYEKAFRLDNSKYAWMYELGLIQFNLANFPAAVAAFKSAVKSGLKRDNDFNENFGYAMLQSGDFEDGEKVLLSVWERKPGTKDILRDMAEVLYAKKKYDRSLVFCQNLMELDAKDAHALYQAGLNFQKNGDKSKGQQMCDRAIQMDPALASLRTEVKMPGM
jgi:tetratricopeptide (TPR) repeat protein